MSKTQNFPITNIKKPDYPNNLWIRSCLYTSALREFSSEGFKITLFLVLVLYQFYIDHLTCLYLNRYLAFFLILKCFRSDLPIFTNSISFYIYHLLILSIFFSTIRVYIIFMGTLSWFCSVNLY